MKRQVDRGSFSLVNRFVRISSMNMWKKINDEDGPEGKAHEHEHHLHCMPIGSRCFLSFKETAAMVFWI